MTRYRAHIQELFDAAQIRLASLPERSGWRATGEVEDDRIKGMLWGSAIGDALGNTSESKTPAARAERFGEVRDYLPNRWARGRAVGVPSDDTQLTVWLLEAMLDARGVDLASISRSFRRSQIFGLGETVRRWLREVEELGEQGELWQARQHSAGNGALMRLAGVIAPYAWTLDDELIDAVILTSALTHDDATSTASCVAFAQIIRELLAGRAQVRPGYFVETFLRHAAPLEGAVKLRPRAPRVSSFKGSLCEFIERHMPAALEAGLDVRQTCEPWYSGAFLLETVPSVLYILERHAHDPEEALVRAVNDTKDNDTIAAIVGAVVGAQHGLQALPDRWVTGLLGRTTHDDDGQLERVWQRLLREAARP